MPSSTAVYLFGTGYAGSWLADLSKSGPIRYRFCEWAVSGELQYPSETLYHDCDFHLPHYLHAFLQSHYWWIIELSIIY